MKLICPDCGKQYDTGKFCLECGAKLQEAVPELVCPSCGFKAKSGKFCPECGTKLIEQIVAPGTARAEESVERKFNERDERFAKYYDRKGFPREIPQEERDISIEELTTFADQNMAEAKMLLGGILMSSSDKDTVIKGITLLKQAEKEGDKLAYYMLGWGYYLGFEPLIKQNHEEAERRMLEAYQEYQDGGTAALLAELYTFSEEKCDYKKAFDYATIAAEEDEKEGYFILGTLYFNGWGVEKDTKLALDNYKMAAAFGHETAMNQIGIIFMGNEGIEENPEQSFYWFSEAAKKGSDVGMFNVGYCYKNGFGVEADIEKASEWFKKSAELGYVEAMIELGEYYLENLVDYNKANMWYLKAAELEHPQAYCALGRIFNQGLGVEVDHSAALKWFEKAADLGVADAQNAVGNYYLEGGDIVKADPQKAFKYYTLSASQDHPYGMLNLALCYGNGHGTSVNIEESKKWMKKAADAGVQDAIDILNGVNEEQQLTEISETRPDIEITDVWVDNAQGDKTFTMHYDLKVNKRYKESDGIMCLIGIYSKDHHGIQYNDGTSWPYSNASSILTDCWETFAAKQMGLKYDGIYDFVVNLMVYPGSLKNLDFADEMADRAQEYQYQFELTLDVTTHRFSNADIKVKNFTKIRRV